MAFAYVQCNYIQLPLERAEHACHSARSAMDCHQDVDDGKEARNATGKEETVWVDGSESHFDDANPHDQRLRFFCSIN